ncbi:MAG: hypothetical protein VW907_05460 [Opitutae bacterium]
MSLATQIAKPNISTVFLVEHTAALWLRAWVLTASQTITYEIPLTHHGLNRQDDITVTGVTEDGTALTSQSSVANVESNPGSYYYDASNFKIHVSSASGDVFDNEIVAKIKFTFSNKSKVINGRYYDARISQVPDLSLRIEPDFSDPVQIGTGSITYINTDGFFDKLTDIQWHGGEVNVLLGAEDINGAQMAYVDYEQIGKWLVDTWSVSRESIEFSLVEFKSRGKKKIPVERYDRATYPAIENSLEGEPIPIAFGALYGVKAAPIDPGVRKFKLASHAIRQIMEVRVKESNTEAWSVVQTESQDLANAEFTLSAADWTDNRDVSVDFEGMKDADGWLLSCAPDVIEKILANIGETDLDTTAFATCKSYLTVGLAKYDRPKYAPEISLYIDEEVEALEAIGRVNEAARTFVFSDPTGQWTIGSFLPKPSESLTHIDIDLGDCLELTTETFAEDLISKSNVKFAERRQEGYFQNTSFTNSAFRYISGDQSEILEDVEVNLSARNDAKIWAQRRVQMRGPAQKVFQILMPHTALQYQPGDQIRVTETRRDIDEVLEVLEIKISFGSSIPRVELVCQRMREHGRECGFLVDSTDTLPARFAHLTGYSSGGITWNSSWDPEELILPWVRQNVAYIATDQHKAVDADKDSHLPGFVV